MTLSQECVLARLYPLVPGEQPYRFALLIATYETPVTETLFDAPVREEPALQNVEWLVASSLDALVEGAREKQVMNKGMPTRTYTGSKRTTEFDPNGYVIGPARARDLAYFIRECEREDIQHEPEENRS